jgi:hypothetical protein
MIMANKNKNNLIHNLKEFVKSKGNEYLFPLDTEMVLDRYDDYLNTQLLKLVINKGKLILVTFTKEFGIEEDNLSDFHSDIVNDIYNVIVK